MVSLLEMGDTLHRGAALLLRVLRMGKDDHNALTKSLAGTTYCMRAYIHMKHDCVCAMYCTLSLVVQA
jgi:hypothetical protein